MSMTGLRDISIINTPPQNRLPILTYIMKYNEKILSEAIHRELERGGQVFFVHNRVQTIESVAVNIRKLVPQARIAVSHGQMHERSLERLMYDFYHKKFDILVTTTIIESGIDIPSCNTIIIYNADKFGLAQLYQLRGRVGRSKERAYAYLFFKDEAIMTENASKRLLAFKNFQELGSGFKLAQKDLEIRGAGNLLGPQQHGQIEAVGYNLYCELLKKVAAEIRGEEEPEELIPSIELGVSAYIPKDYIEDELERMTFYRRLNNIKLESGIESVRTELKDRFGALPAPLETFLSLIKLKITMTDTRISKVSLLKSKLVMESAVPGRRAVADFTKAENDLDTIGKAIQIITDSYILDLI